MSDMGSMLRWPDGLDRTLPEDRESVSKFSASYSQTKREIKKEFQRMGADQYLIDDVTGSGGDPGVVVRWKDDGDEYAIACDAYTNKKSNLRAAYLWINETRKREQRPVRTMQDGFAAAALPGDTADPDELSTPPHEVLSVAPDAPEEVIKASARQLSAKHKPGSGKEPDEQEFKRVQKAKQRMLGGGT